MTKEIPNSFCPSNKQAWRSWLKENHLTKDSIWLIIYKKNSTSPNLTWSEAVDEALCFGWIDSTKKSIDSVKYMQYYSRRKAKSTWSKTNKDKVAHFIDEGLMSPAGLESIEIAKQNGSWRILEEVDSRTIPKDLEKAFNTYDGSKAYFLTLSKSIQKGLLYWVIQAKRPETRVKRINEIVENARNKKIPKQFIS